MATRAKRKGAEKSKDRLNSEETEYTYECSGNIVADFTELCKRAEISFIPPIVSEEKPGQATAAPEQKQSKTKHSVKQSQAELESCSSGKTTKLADMSEVMSPKITVLHEHYDRPDVSECLVKNWKISRYLDILTICWASMEKLTTISLWNVGLSGDESAQMLKCLKRTKCLRAFHLEGNSERLLTYHLFISDEVKVKFLSFRFNRLDDNNALMISRSLQNTRNCDLVSLNISHNNITDKGTVYLAESLRTNKTLLSLDLSNNFVGDRGCLAMGEALSRYELKPAEIAQQRKQKMLSKSNQDSSDHNTTETASQKTEEKPKTSTRLSTKKKKDDEAKSGKVSKRENEKHKKETRSISKSKDKINRERLALEVPKNGAADKRQSLRDKDQVDDSRVFSCGNKRLLNLNLSHNKVTEKGLVWLLNAVQYQQYHRSEEERSVDGLMSLRLDNNLFDENDESAEKIKKLIKGQNPMANTTNLDCPSSGSVHSRK